MDTKTAETLGRVQDPKNMPKMNPIKELFAMITLGLICGWYYFCFILVPFFLYFTWCGSYIAIAGLTMFFVLTVVPLNFEPWREFMYSWPWRIWLEYFDYQYGM
jgi:hypothetical protein